MPRASKLRRLLLSLDISQHNALVIFAVKKELYFRDQLKITDCYLRNMTEAVQLRILLTGTG